MSAFHPNEQRDESTLSTIADPRKTGSLASMHRFRSLVAVQFLSLLVAGCVSATTSLPVSRAVSEAELRNSQVVQVHGVIGSWHSGVNLLSPSRRECIGLLSAQTDLTRLRAYEGQRVTVSGTLQAQGCGREGICDEHLCGPAVLSSVRLVK